MARPRSTLYLEAHVTVVDQDLVAACEHLADDSRRDGQLHVGALRPDDDLLPLAQLQRLGEMANPQLRTLEIGDERDRMAAHRLRSLDEARPLRVLILRAVREVEPGHVHPGLDESRYALGRRGAQRGDDLRATQARGHAQRRRRGKAAQPG
jgi:hypothetical protein